MTKQLRLMDPKNLAGRSAHSHSYHRLDDHTREIGLIGVRDARAALAEANRRVAEREAERRASRDNELADRARTARRTKLTLATDSSDHSDLSAGAANLSTSPSSPDSGSSGHKSAA